MAPTNILTFALLALASSAIAQSTITSAATTAAASGSVVAFTLPGGIDNATYVGSLIGTANSRTTILIGCPEGAATSDCDFYPPVPITVNSNTFIATVTLGTTWSYTYSCTQSSAGATCIAHATGIAAEFATQTTATASLTQIISTSSTDIWNATDLYSYPVTLISGNATGQILGVGQTFATTSSNGTALSTSSSHSSSRSTSSSSGSSSSSVTTFHPTASSSSTRASTAASSSGTSSAAAADVKILAPGVFAAGLVGLAAVLL